jgi:hypothetical protein
MWGNVKLTIDQILTDLKNEVLFNYGLICLNRSRAIKPSSVGISRLERLQRLRKGDDVLARLNLQVLDDAPTISEDQDSDR